MIKLLFILLEVYNPESIVTVLNRYAQNEFRTKKKNSSQDIFETLDKKL